MTVQRPKVVLHDHLDGGVRPETVIDLAAAAKVDLPTRDSSQLATWFTITPGMPFEEAWQRFGVVIDVLQSAESLRRVAREAVEDLAADGVVYAELRFAPLSHLRGGLRPEQVIGAVATGLEESEAETGCIARMIVCGLRENEPEESLRAAHLAAASADSRVVGFDLAGNEFDFGADLHAEAFAVARQGELGVTVHAGEMAGPGSIASALNSALPSRIGHGLHLIDDCVVTNGKIAELGPVAREIVQRQIMLEVCLTSNSCLGTPVASHPVRLFHDAGIAVSVNPDDRAITTTTVAHEYGLWRNAHGFTNRDFRDINLRAVDAAFCEPDTKAELRDLVAAGWA